MRVERTLHELALPTKGMAHAARRRNVALAVWSLLKGRRASLTAIGRGLDVATSDRHRIKRCDRLIGNVHLHAELPVFYAAITRRLLSGVRRPVLLVDWTNLHKHALSLVVAVPVEGRAVPIHVETVDIPMPKQAMRRAERSALAHLHRTLPEGAQPILVADAGFRASFMRDVAAMGWGFVVRLRGLQQLKIDGASWTPIRQLLREARPRAAADLGQGHLTKEAQGIRCRFVLSARPRKGPDRRRWYVPHHSAASVKAQRAAKEPLLVATNVADLSATDIVALYRRRMRIEEAFRDAKNARYGWFLEGVRSRQAKRYDVLWMVVSLAMLTVILIGLAAELRNLHHRFQANTERTRRTLSWFTLGNLVLQRPQYSRVIAPRSLAFLAPVLGV